MVTIKIIKEATLNPSRTVMELFHLIAVLLTLSAIFSYINYRFFKLPTTIGVMLISLASSLALIILNQTGLALEDYARKIIESIDFDKTLLHGMLSFLLFAGALHVNLNNLAKQKWIIASTATVGLLTSAFLVGTATYYILLAFGLQISFIYCLLFGALISPTDPIAVLAILKQANAPKSLETKIAGESLFNDGIAVVLFIVILQMATGSSEVGAGIVVKLLLKEAVGGIVLGLILGSITYHIIKSIDNYQVEILLTLALVTGGYSLAMVLHTSGPLAIVVAGLLIGNQGRSLAMSEKTCGRLDDFWELIDELLNIVLFVLIGLEVMILGFSGENAPSTSKVATIAILMIPVVLIARFVAIAIPVTILKKYREFSPNITAILTWGGLRGGISVALALSLPEGFERDFFLVLTYTVVIFSITVQGLTIKQLIVSSIDKEQDGA